MSSSSSRQQRSTTPAQWLEALEARLNPPMSDDEEIIDPFADLPDGGHEQLKKLRLMFHWTPPKEMLH